MEGLGAVPLVPLSERGGGLGVRWHGCSTPPYPSLLRVEAKVWLNYGFVTVRPVTRASVLCAKRMPYTPSVDLSLPAVTSADLS
jgi:hypothetical protein